MIDAKIYSQDQIAKINEILKEQSPQEIINYFYTNHAGRIALSSSLGAEDQVLTDMIVKKYPEARIFTLDTGRMFKETYELIDEVNEKYQIHIEVFFPDYHFVEKLVNEKGIRSFYKSIANRKECCRIRKIAPLKRALEGLDVWVCGLRKDQSVTRFFNEIVELDTGNNLLKISPLLNWTEDQVWEYIKQNNVPYNKLHDQNYPSIGCQPCTRAVEPGEDIRSGRWWWEEPEQKECGLHKK